MIIFIPAGLWLSASPWLCPQSSAYPFMPSTRLFGAQEPPSERCGPLSLQSHIKFTQTFYLHVYLIFKLMYWVRAVWWEGQLPHSVKVCLLIAHPPTLCTGLVFLHTHANVDLASRLFFLPAVEERLLLRSKLGPCLKRAPDGSLRPHDLWRRCGGLSSQGEGGAEGGAEREERWHQPHHPGKQRLHQHTQQPQPQCISATLRLPLTSPTSHLLRFLLLLHPHRAFPQPSVEEIPFAGDLYIL